MSLPNNYLKFPDNVFEPKRIIFFGDPFTLHKFYFRGLNDLYNYLKKDPKINTDVWNIPYLISSLDKDLNFGGKPYDQAVEDLINYQDDEYKHFLSVEKNFNATLGSVHKYVTKKEIAGGKINVPAYVAGSPLCYTTSKTIKKPKFITINISLSYSCMTTREQLFNRAVIITNLISALESSGYTVNVNTFELDRKKKELFNVIFELKRYGERINYPALYKSLCSVEFLRRICFRLLETSDVTANWTKGYGNPCNKEEAVEVLKINKNDIFFDQPIAMGIKGHQLVMDFENAMDVLEMDNYIDLKSATEDFKAKVKRM